MNVRHTVDLPDIGDYDKVSVAELLVKEGDRIAVDDPILTLESDKAAIEVPSPVAGVIRELLVEIGSIVSKGMPIVVVETTTEQPADASHGASAGTTTDFSPVSDASAHSIRPGAESSPATSRRINLRDEPTGAGDFSLFGTGAHFASCVRTSPSVRAYARQLGIDLSAVVPTGPRGRLLREDIQNYAKKALAIRPPTAVANPLAAYANLPPWPRVDFAKFGDVEHKPLSRIQALSGANIARNWVMIPHVTNFDIADVTELEAFRTKMNAETPTPAAKLTMVTFLVKAAASALKAFPQFNASLDGGNMVLKRYVHIGFAVDTPKGLVVPVIRDCDRKGVLEIGIAIAALADKARKGELSLTESQGGSFSVSSLGSVRGTGFTPIINAPEVAILGAARTSMQPVWDGERFVPRLTMPISLSWDHRAVDGAAAARFLGYIADLLGDFRRVSL